MLISMRLVSPRTARDGCSAGNLAIKLLRTFTMQVEALHRYRGKGQQKVTVEHVHVNAGGQAIVGTVHPPDVKKKWNERDAPREITQGQDCGARTRSGNPCRSPAVRGKRRCRMHGGAAGSGAPMRNKNALRHGHYSAEAIAQRRELAELIRQSRATLAEGEAEIAIQ
jgi:hypothetical protein